MPVHTRRLDQTHHRCRSLARAQATGEQPVAAANGDGPDLVLDPIVVHGQFPVIGKADECSPALEAVIQRLGGGRSVGHLAPLLRHPFVQGVQERPRSLLPNCEALLSAELLDLTLDLVNAGQLLQRTLGDLALVGRVLIEELATRVRQAAHLGDAGSQQRFVPAAMWCKT